MNWREKKRKNFIKLAEKRVENVCHTIRLIGNLSNTNNYQYKKSDVKQIIEALQNSVKKCELVFKRELSSNPPGFKLK